MLGTAEVVDQLRKAGYQVSNGYLAYLLRERVFSPPVRLPGGAFGWTDANIERLRMELRRRGRGPVDGAR